MVRRNRKVAREVKEVIDKKTGVVIPVPQKERPTYEAYAAFKRPAYQNTNAAKLKKGCRKILSGSPF